MSYYVFAQSQIETTIDTTIRYTTPVQQDSGGLSTGAIITYILAAVTIICLVFFVIKKLKRSKNTNSSISNTETKSMPVSAMPSNTHYQSKPSVGVTPEQPLPSGTSSKQLKNQGQ